MNITFKLINVEKCLRLKNNYWSIQHVLKILNSVNFNQQTKTSGAKYTPIALRQEKPYSIYWLIKKYGDELTDSQIAKLVGITKNSVTSIRNKSYWNYNNLNPKDPVALNLFTQKDLIEAIEKAERRIKREKRQKEKLKQS